MKYLKNKLYLGGCLLITSLCATSCLGIHSYEPLKFKIISNRGPIAYVLCGYFEDNQLNIEKDESLIEKAFESSEYGIIGYDTIKGLELCEKYNKHVLLQNYVGGSYTLISTNPEVTNTFEGCKILANNEKGALGAILSLIQGNLFINDISYVESPSYEFYTDIRNGNYLSDYDFIALSAPYAQRLIADDQESNLAYGKVTQSFRLFNVYGKMMDPNVDNYDDYFYAEEALFVSKDLLNDESLSKNYQSFIKTINIITDNAINDPYQTMTQFNRNSKDRSVQFETYGFSIDEIGELQNWEQYNNVKIPYNHTRFTTTFSNDDLIKYLELIGKNFDSNLFYQDK
ncbi:MAG: hypothetical protein ACI4U5_02085 [Bacilli bacterium]